MLFSSLTFIVFFLLVLLVHQIPFPWRVRKLNLLLASYLFYAAWNPPFVVLLWISTLADWFIAKRLVRTVSLPGRRLLLASSLGLNLGLLGFFKYGSFLIENFVAAVGLIGIEYSPAAPDIILPVGISFYTFQTLSYTFDVYRKKSKPWHSFLDYALFVTFFPQLVAGPIVRAVDFLPQCVDLRRASAKQLAWGLHLIVLGLFAKVILADALLAPVADTVYASWQEAGFATAWLGTLAFSAQIFFDFSGYSTCAIGAGLCLGFALPDNFRRPYGAVGFADFWRRWHISLSTWLRDYLYISLGGNRHGMARTNINLMVTMLLGGLWHGASWRFVVWGGLHGSYLVAERILKAVVGDAPIVKRRLVQILLALITYYFVCLTWVFFRAQDFESAFALVKVMLAGWPGTLELSPVQTMTVLGVTVVMLTTHWILRNSSLEQAIGRAPGWLRAVWVAAMLVALAMAPGDDRAFIYFQF